MPSSSPTKDCAQYVDPDTCSEQGCQFYHSLGCVQRCLHTSLLIEKQSLGDIIEQSNSSYNADACEEKCAKMLTESRNSTNSIRPCFAMTFEEYGKICTLFADYMLGSSSDPTVESRICFRPSPTFVPTQAPVTSVPTNSPTVSLPSVFPTRCPSRTPSIIPSTTPTSTPSDFPISSNPSTSPSGTPSTIPSRSPSKEPSISVPTRTPTVTPSNLPSICPTWSDPTNSPTTAPTEIPTPSPTRCEEDDEACMGSSRCVDYDVMKNFLGENDCTDCNNRMKRLLCCQCIEKLSNFSRISGGIQKLMDKSRQEVRDIVIPLNSNITSDISLQLNVHSRWSFAAWLKGSSFEFDIFKTCYHFKGDRICESLRIYDQSLVWESCPSSRECSEYERHSFGSEKIFTDSRIGRHIFLIHYARTITVYRDGQLYANWYVPDEFLSPPVKVRNITFGTRSQIYELGEVHYYYNNVDQEKILSFYYSEQSEDWIDTEPEDCKYCLSTGETSSITLFGILAIVGYIVLASSSIGYNKKMNLASHKKTSFIQFYSAVLGHMSKWVLVYTMCYKDWRWGMGGIFILSMRLIIAVFLFLSYEPGVETWQIGMIAAAGNLTAATGFMTSGFFADSPFFTSRADFEPLLESNWILFQPFFLVLILAGETSWTLNQGFDASVLIAVWYSVCMVLYGIMSHFLAKTQTLQLAMFPPVDEEKTSYTYSAKLRKILNEAVNQEIMEVSRITQVNNTAFTCIRVEVFSNARKEVDWHDLGYIMIGAYKELDADFDHDGSVCLPLDDLDQMKQSMHNRGFHDSDHLLTAGASALRKRNTMVRKQVDNVVMLAKSTEMQTHRAMAMTDVDEFKDYDVKVEESRTVWIRHASPNVEAKRFPNAANLSELRARHVSNISPRLENTLRGHGGEVEMPAVMNGREGSDEEFLEVEGGNAGTTKHVTFGGESFEEDREDSYQSLHNGEYLDVKSGEHVRRVS